MPALVNPRPQRNAEKGLTVLGVALHDAREEAFVLMVCDGLPMGLAFKRAGFTSKDNNAPFNLFHLPRVQERAAAILEARRTTGVVTLSEVTSMLQRVFAGAHAKEEFNAAHNAAFSLARLYGHVTDRATLEVIRRPSRDPDEPSEQALEAWAASLPIVSPEPLQALESGPEDALKGPLPHAPAALLRPDSEPSSPEGPGPDLCSDIKELDWLEGPGQIGNGAPVGPVTGAPHTGARTEILGPERVPVKNREKVASIPSFKELFGE